MCKGLNDHPHAIPGHGLPDVLSRADRVAHVMQTIEDGHEVVIFAWKVFCAGHLEGNAIGNTVTLGGLTGRFNRLVMVVEAEEFRFGECFRHQDCGSPFAAADVSYPRPCFELLLDTVQGGYP